MAQIKLYSPLTERIEAVELENRAGGPRPLTLYVCGITPYDTTHLGHAFAYAVADHLIRLLEYLGHTVTYVQNVTDIDDDILRKANEVGEEWRSLGNRWTTHFIQDMQRLNIRPPDYYPRASDFIPRMIQAIEALVEQEMAYVANGSVYYRAEAWPHFGNLSGLPEDELLPIANERGNIADDPDKRDPLDFPLWQAQKPGEPAWNSPWGPGRPGWHIECSTMATELLGDVIDFHGGGDDLAFPHHECEIAQAEPVTGTRPFVRHWVHAAMVEHEDEKMSKSLGNLVMARDLLEDFTPDALRLYLASTHYRQAWAYDREALEEAAATVENWSAAVTATASPSASGTNHHAPSAFHTDGHASYGAGQTPFAELRQEFIAALSSDLDTPGAIKVLDRFAHSLHTAVQEGQDIGQARRHFMHMAAVLGLRLISPMPEPAVIQGWNHHLQQFSMERERSER